MAKCLHYSTITKHSNLNLIDRLQFPWLTASISLQFRTYACIRAKFLTFSSLGAEDDFSLQTAFVNLATTSHLIGLFFEANGCLNCKEVIWLDLCFTFESAECEFWLDNLPMEIKLDQVKSGLCTNWKIKSFCGRFARPNGPASTAL